MFEHDNALSNSNISQYYQTWFINLCYFKYACGIAKECFAHVYRPTYIIL